MPPPLAGSPSLFMLTIMLYLGLSAGKTGTSQVNEYYEGDNTVSEYQVAFCGFFPANKPKYSMIVSLNKIGLPASGGGMAGDAFHNIVEWMIDNGMLNK